MKEELEPRLVAPINRLPVEILSTIFLLGLRDYHADDKDSKRPQRYQGLISLVCHRWKTIIEATPIAWARITVLDGQPFQITKRFLRLSRTCLINVFIVWRETAIYYDGAHSIDEMNKLFALLLPEAHRWRSLHVTIVYHELSSYVMQRLQWVSAPNLGVLGLREGCCRGPAQFATKYKLFQSSPGAPVLRDITLWGFHVD